ncbi:MAG: HIT domain-containing protein [Candidatus Wallbacteria bacterium]|nr:HIT domain-containing protein [Candidatus Wallbacteria bacterium]MBI4865587.1 HIT domain-containing protein [Candidatus Wallbacteria bacterium]
MLRSHLFVPSKREYVRGNRPQVECILCDIIAGRDTVDRLEIFRDDLFSVSLNLHPYNSGHLMVFPMRHVEDPRELSRDEVVRLHRLQCLAFDVLQQRYRPSGFNVGYNYGEGSGASIRHYHLHIVPRYYRELGFMDILGGAKIIVEDPMETMADLRERFRMVAETR